jgi:hypothetical protein
LGWGEGYGIPNTQGRFPLAAGVNNPFLSFGGSDRITRQNLPNASLTGTTQIQSNDHTHTMTGYTATGSTSTVPATNSTETNVIAFSPARTVVSDNGAALGGTTDNSYLALSGADRSIANSNTNHSHSVSVNIPTRTSGGASHNHTHAFVTDDLNGGVVQTKFMPLYAVMNHFIYLGE